MEQLWKVLGRDVMCQCQLGRFLIRVQRRSICTIQHADIVLTIYTQATINRVIIGVFFVFNIYK